MLDSLIIFALLQYMTFPDSVKQPVRNLRGFCKEKYAAGESQTLTFPIRAKDMATYSSESGSWSIPSGEFKFSIGSSSRMKDLPVSVTVQVRLFFHQASYSTRTLMLKFVLRFRPNRSFDPSRCISHTSIFRSSGLAYLSTRYCILLTCISMELCCLNRLACKLRTFAESSTTNPHEERKGGRCILKAG